MQQCIVVRTPGGEQRPQVVSTHSHSSHVSAPVRVTSIDIAVEENRINVRLGRRQLLQLAATGDTHVNTTSCSHEAPATIAAPSRRVRLRAGGVGRHPRLRSSRRRYKELWTWAYVEIWNQMRAHRARGERFPVLVAWARPSASNRGSRSASVRRVGRPERARQVRVDAGWPPACSAVRAVVPLAAGLRSRSQGGVGHAPAERRARALAWIACRVSHHQSIESAPS